MTRVILETQAQRDQLDPKDPLVRLARKDLKASKGYGVRKAILAHQVRRVRRVTRVIRERREHKGKRVTRVILVQLARLVQLVHKAQQVQLGHKASKE